MAAKKTPKPSKKPRNKATKPAGRPAKQRPGAKARVKPAAAKGKTRDVAKLAKLAKLAKPAKVAKVAKAKAKRALPAPRKAPSKAKPAAKAAKRPAPSKLRTAHKAAPKARPTLRKVVASKPRAVAKPVRAAKPPVKAGKPAKSRAPAPKPLAKAKKLVAKAKKVVAKAKKLVAKAKKPVAKAKKLVAKAKKPLPKSAKLLAKAAKPGKLRKPIAPPAPASKERDQAVRPEKKGLAKGSPPALPSKKAPEGRSPEGKARDSHERQGRAAIPPPPPASAPSKAGQLARGKVAPRPSSPAKAPSKPPPDRRSSPGKAPLKEKASLRQSRPPLREAPPRLVALPLPILAPPRRPSIEERASVIETRLAAQTDDFRKRYEDNLDMSWIYHDSALEGVVYTFEELRTALSGQAPPVTDSSLQPTYDDIRRHKEAIEFVRDYGMRKKLPVTIDIVKKIFLILHPEEGDIKTVRYRKDIPQHRLYFHEYAPPDKIGYKVRQIVDWLNDPETRKTRNGIRIAARAHYDLLRVYPFATDSGKASRLFMNLLLMRTGLPPAIIHSTERQRYYEALKGSATTVLQMVQEAVENALSSVEKLLDEHETRKRAFVS